MISIRYVIPGLLRDVEEATEYVKRGRFKDWRKVRKEAY